MPAYEPPPWVIFEKEKEISFLLKLNGKVMYLTLNLFLFLFNSLKFT
jgi:hypothetical protein